MRRSLSPRFRVRFAILGPLLGGFVLTAACSDSGGDATFTADDGVVDGMVTVLGRDIEFDRSAYAATAGDIDVLLANEGNIIHSLVVEGVDGFRLVTQSNGDTDEGTVELDAGEYVIYCDIAGHRAAGMEATLEVEG